MSVYITDSCVGEEAECWLNHFLIEYAYYVHLQL